MSDLKKLLTFCQKSFSDYPETELSDTSGKVYTKHCPTSTMKPFAKNSYLAHFYAHAH